MPSDRSPAGRFLQFLNGHREPTETAAPAKIPTPAPIADRAGIEALFQKLLPLRKNLGSGTTSRILVKLHLGSFVEAVALDTSSLTDLGPDGQLKTRTVNNVLRNEI